MSIIKKITNQIPYILQTTLNIALFILAIILCIMLAKELVFFVQQAIFTEDISHYELLENILLFFLYFEFIAMIVKYFKEDYHFPLRYFLYIGITALIRLIIVSHDNPLHTLLYATAILVLIIGYYILNSAKEKKEKL